MGLFDLFHNDAAEDAARVANQHAQLGYAQLSDLYGQGRDALTSQYGKAADLYTGLMGQYQPGAAAYGDWSGAGGVEGLQRATDLYKNSGQYGMYGLANDAAQQAIQRTGAAGGNLLSGNVLEAAIKKGQDLGQQYWGQFGAGLSPYLQAQGNTAQNLGNVYTGLGGGLNQSFMGQGGAANQTQTTMGNNLAGAEMNKYKVGANQLGAITGIGSLLTGGLGQGWAKPLFSGFGGSNG